MNLHVPSPEFHPELQKRVGVLVYFDPLEEVHFCDSQEIVILLSVPHHHQTVDYFLFLSQIFFCRWLDDLWHRKYIVIHFLLPVHVPQFVLLELSEHISESGDYSKLLAIQS